MSDLRKRLDLIIPKIRDEKFLKGRGLGNEISFYVFDYDPREELFVRKYIDHIKREFEKPDSNIKIIEFDLYNMMIDFAKERQVFEALIQMEETEVKRPLPGHGLFCEPTMFIERIGEESKGYHLILITGVGKAFPFIRSHTILNNLMERIEGKPLILFYPGVYDELSLQLFGIMKDDNYYRAFRLIDVK